MTNPNELTLVERPILQFMEGMGYRVIGPDQHPSHRPGPHVRGRRASVVAHELTHLLHRNHSREFWDALGTTMPDWADRKAMLERWETEHRAV